MNGTASKNLFTRRLLLVSMRNLLPWPSHRTCCSFPISRLWIHILILEGLKSRTREKKKKKILYQLQKLLDKFNGKMA